MLNLQEAESIKLQISGLDQAYIEACERKDYITCDIIRLELTRVLTGKKLLIPTGQDYSQGIKNQTNTLS